MKHFKKLLLIHWHYFSIEEIEFSGINFLTGKTAAGKSTIIDAMQLLFFGDTSGAFFNKAANGRSDRSLVGYLRGELGDDGSTGYRYLRDGRFTSYIAAEFYDDVKKNCFTAGCCFDYYSENDYPHKFFIFNGPIPKNTFMTDGIPLEIKELRAFIKDTYKLGKYELPDSNKDFRNKLYSKFGGLSDRFGDLLKRAVPFAPINNIQDFITQFVCNDARPVDIRTMQDNIRHYKDLEHEANALREKVGALQEIKTVYENYTGFTERAKLHDYTVSRAEHQKQINQRDLYINIITKNKKDIGKLNVEIKSLTETRNKLDERRIQNVIDLQNSSAQQTLNRLEEQRTEISKKISDISHECDYVKASMRKYGIGWRGIFENNGKNLERTGQINEQLHEDTKFFANLVTDCKADAEILLNANEETLMFLVEQGLVEIKTRIEKVRTFSGILKNNYSRECMNLSEQKSSLEATEANLKKGIKPFNSAVVTLKERIAAELSSKYSKLIEVNIFSELIEIRDERWRNAIEAYLHTQKFYILIEPAYFQDALGIYERIKHEFKIYDVGLVDIQKIMQKRPSIAAVSGSLAVEISTSNSFARVYGDYLLGNVMKCDEVSELRNYERAITDGGMLYQGYVARQLNPKRWENPYIGRNAIERQLERVREDIQALREPINFCSHMAQALKAFESLELINQNDIDRTISALREGNELPSLSTQLAELIKDITGIDKGYIDKLQQIIDALKEEIEELDVSIKTINQEIGGFENYNREKTQEVIPSLCETIDNLQNDLDKRFDEEWIRLTGEPKFYREISARPSPEDVITVFGQQLNRARNQTKEKWEQLIELRGNYNSDYKMGHDINNKENIVYEKGFTELSEVRLPDYIGKIQNAKEKAFEQFQEDFLGKIKANIDDVRSQINQLNDAIRKSSFGQDTYFFEMYSRTEYKRYYEMITDPMLIEGGYNLMSEHFNNKYKEEIKELFDLITDSGKSLNADARAEYEKRVQEFTNYRTYLNFDLKVTDSDGFEQRLSKTLGKKSGGETQTPFYISVLASFAQLYRIKKGTDSGTIRIIIFDEAFSKMDGERIRESIRLLRQFGFQVILSAPPEKISDIANLVDRNLCVLRKGNMSFVKTFDPKQLGDAFDDEL